MQKLYEINGTIQPNGKSAYKLIYAKQEALILVKKIYYCDKITFLSRKKLKIDAVLDIIAANKAGMLKLVDRHA